MAIDAFPEVEQEHYQRVEDLERDGWEVVSSTSVERDGVQDLLEGARAITPALLYDGPLLAVTTDGRYVCMRKEKPGFESSQRRVQR